ncbi:MAG: PorT family protein [Flavobacteriaceae bacterium]|nr:PorT family protein [Flavobacteriaceae bacterium]
MKKILMLAAIAVLSFTTAQAQGVSFGAKAGVNFASLTGDDADMLELEGRTGFHIGAVANISISELFAVQPEIVYSTQGFTLEEMGVEGTGKLDYINIPVMADFTVAEGFSLQGGPQIGINVTDEFEAEGETETLDAESTDFGAAIGAQYRSALGLFVQARYTIGLSNVAGDDEDDVDLKNGVISISAGWFF